MGAVQGVVLMKFHEHTTILGLFRSTFQQVSLAVDNLFVTY